MYETGPHWRRTDTLRERLVDRGGRHPEVVVERRWEGRNGTVWLWVPEPQVPEGALRFRRPGGR
jgi:hypothetical protein